MSLRREGVRRCVDDGFALRWVNLDWDTSSSDSGSCTCSCVSLGDRDSCCCVLSRRECVYEGASSFDGCRDSGRDEVEPARAGCTAPGAFLRGKEVLLLAGVGGVLPSVGITGLPAC